MGFFSCTDGKLYDAYVSYICSGDQSASSTAAFALRALPEVLEDRLGYRLFIRGRDDPPGAGTDTATPINDIHIRYH